jgi:steroid 5-alpha reductase family enzyme
MQKTIMFLCASLISVPIASVYLDDPLSALQTEALVTVGWIYLAASFIAFLAGELSKNYSQVDRLWSTIPIAYVWVMAAYDWTARTVLMASLVTLWGVRLSLNFTRRGGFSWVPWRGEEDYRWSVLQKNPLFDNRLAWSAFNLGFICYYQMGLVLLMTLPMIPVLGSDVPLGLADYVLAAVLVGLVAMETLADQQQWEFHREKGRLKASAEEMPPRYAKGFVAEGLWSWCRHPNYFAEQSFWVVFYGFSVAATGRWVNGSAAGFILLLLLFQGSANFSEGISAGKYPAYKKYCESRPRFIPKPW